MTAARKPATAKKTSPAPVSVADLPDNKGAQISEAMQEPVTFAMGDETTFTFKPLMEWDYASNIAFAVGDVRGWARGALEDPEQAGAFLSRTVREVGRIVRYFDDMTGTTRGEGRSSSTS